MTPVSFPQKNFTFTKPANMTDEECSSLEVYRGDGLIISKWIPSEEDLKNLNEGAAMWLTIAGTGMPPVCLQTTIPFKEASQISA